MKKIIIISFSKSGSWRKSWMVYLRRVLMNKLYFTVLYKHTCSQSVFLLTVASALITHWRLVMPHALFSPSFWVDYTLLFTSEHLCECWSLKFVKCVSTQQSQWLKLNSTFNFREKQLIVWFWFMLSFLLKLKLTLLNFAKEKIFHFCSKSKDLEKYQDTRQSWLFVHIWRSCVRAQIKKKKTNLFCCQTYFGLTPWLCH